MLTDPVADMLTRIRNANLARHETVSMPTSKLKVEIARLLLDEGYVEAFSVARGEEAFDVLTVTLKYADDRRRVIQGIKRISKPGRRVYDADAAAEKVRQKGRRTLAIAIDLRKRSEVEAMVKQVVDAFGRIDILVNCTMASHNQEFLNFKEEDFDDSLNRGVKSYFLTCQAAARQMVNSAPGKSSISAPSSACSAQARRRHGPPTAAGSTASPARRRMLWDFMGSTSMRSRAATPRASLIAPASWSESADCLWAERRPRKTWSSPVFFSHPRAPAILPAPFSTSMAAIPSPASPTTVIAPGGHAKGMKTTKSLGIELLAKEDP